VNYTWGKAMTNSLGNYALNVNGYSGAFPELLQQRRGLRSGRLRREARHLGHGVSMPCRWAADSSSFPAQTA
jgi:hypothetical protein